MINDKAIPLYQVKVNGKVYQTEQIRVSAIPFNRTWPGKQRDVSQSEIAYMVRIFDEESVNVEIESSVDFENVMVRPLSKKITPHTEGRKISFSIYLSSVIQKPMGPRHSQSGATVCRL